MLEKILPTVFALLLLSGDTIPDVGKVGQPAVVVPQPSPNQITTKIDPPEPKDINWSQQQKIFEYGKAAMLDQCKDQPQNLWCSEVLLPEKTLTPWQIMNISLDTKSNFRYVSDVIDNWRVHSSSVLAKEVWRGDCDDLTSTTLDIMIRNGQPRGKAWFALVDVNHKRLLDHLVGVVQDADGKFWIVGDTSSQNAYPIEQLKYRVVAIANVADVAKWKDPRDAEIFPESVLQRNPVIPEPIVTLLDETGVV